MLVFIILSIAFCILWMREKKANDASRRAVEELERSLREKEARIKELDIYQEITDVTAEVARIRAEAQQAAQADKDAAKDLRQKARETLDHAQDKALTEMKQAKASAEQIIQQAREQAKSIAGDALEAKERSDEWAKLASAMKNIVEGYGDEYLKPTFSLLDELAEEFGHTEAGEKLKDARANSARMVKSGTAATCDYVENHRKETAIRFVVDAFNGKVDSILSKTKKDNHGVLEQRIKDAFTLVNANGQAFRNARIEPAYLQARLDELKWACIASELKFQEREEQRRIREQMREEERARKEYERAIREAEREEEALQKAMSKVQQQLEAAKEEQRAEYEAKLQELEERLKEAQEKNQRALSMAQQTKRGNVYIISNVGAFGENIYKIGMTRRLEPMDRVRELGDASVPFSFDVHAMIESEDAPALENSLHKSLALMQVNKVNPRKEFFRVSLADIRKLIDGQGLEANWTMQAEAAEYRETLAIEKRMKDDPTVQKQWEAFATSIEGKEKAATLAEA